jgi:hypothetical protein
MFFASQASVVDCPDRDLTASAKQMYRDFGVEVSYNNIY